MNAQEQMRKLAEKAQKEWGESWTVNDMECDIENNLITVWVGRADVYKAFFSADTLRCVGTKC